MLDGMSLNLAATPVHLQSPPQAKNGYRVLRFLAEDVGKDLDAVLDTILRSLARGPGTLS